MLLVEPPVGSADSTGGMMKPYGHITTMVIPSWGWKPRVAVSAVLSRRSRCLDVRLKLFFGLGLRRSATLLVGRWPERKAQSICQTEP